MFLQFKNYRNANEVLYVLDSVERNTEESLSKIGLQKLCYLAVSFAPIKDILLSLLRYKRWHRGPYSFEVQNTVDHLVSYGLVDVTDFEVKRENLVYVSYKISEGGKRAVNTLKKYSIEEEKAWWIDCITRLSYMYSQDEYLVDENDFNGIDKIIRLVYKDKTFINIDEEYGKGGYVDFGNEDGITQQLIEIIRMHVESSEEFLKLPERTLAELILVSFFEQLYANYIVSINSANG